MVQMRRVTEHMDAVVKALRVVCVERTVIPPGAEYFWYLIPNLVNWPLTRLRIR